MSTWIALITSLPTENATARMRAWRNLKASGAAVLRDGVYLMPEREDCRNTLIASPRMFAQRGDGAGCVLKSPDGNSVVRPQCRLRQSAGRHFGGREGLSPDTANEAVKQARKLRKAFTNLAAIDFFPGEAQKQADEALRDLEQRAARALSPDEPHPVDEAIARLSIHDYQGRFWATRRRPWVDRLACAWLIRRCIDPQAKLLWLATPSDCPADAPVDPTALH